MAARSIPMQLDPVCGMPLDSSWATASSAHAGNTHYFCCRGCKAEFDKNPDNFVESEPKKALGGDGPCGRQG
jgi:YHS domain-containing protein